MSDEKDRTVLNLAAAQPGWDTRPLTLAYEVKTFLQSIKDAGTEVDSGTDGKSADLWVTVSGVEYFINIKPRRAAIDAARGEG